MVVYQRQLLLPIHAHQDGPRRGAWVVCPREAAFSGSNSHAAAEEGHLPSPTAPMRIPSIEDRPLGRHTYMGKSLHFHPIYLSISFFLFAFFLSIPSGLDQLLDGLIQRESVLLGAVVVVVVLGAIRCGAVRCGAVPRCGWLPWLLPLYTLQYKCPISHPRWSGYLRRTRRISHSVGLEREPSTGELNHDQSPPFRLRLVSSRLHPY